MGFSNFIAKENLPDYINKEELDMIQEQSFRNIFDKAFMTKQENDVYRYGEMHTALLKEIYTYFKYADLLDDKNLYNLYVDILSSFHKGQYNGNWRDRIKKYYKKVNNDKK